MKFLSIRSRLMSIILTLGIAMAVGIAWIAWSLSSKAMTENAFSQLTALREARKHEVQSYFDQLKTDFALFASAPGMADDIRDLSSAFASVDTSDVDLAALRAGYQEKYFKEFTARGLDPKLSGAERHFPEDKRSQKLQLAYYVSNPGGWEEKLDWLRSSGKWRVPGYDSVHARLHENLKQVALRRGWEDIMLIDPDGNIIYTVYKESDFGMNVLEGSLSRTSLADAFRRAASLNDQTEIVLEDFRLYPPSFNAPAAFLAEPVYDAKGALAGVVATELPIDAVDQAMTASHRWKESGFGDTGETYLVGPDKMLRSTSRFLIEDKDAYFAALEKSGLSQSQIAQINMSETSVLVQPADSEAVQAALRGETGTITSLDYRNVDVLSAYSPLNAGGLRWAIIAEIDKSEALAPVRRFRDLMLMATTGAAILLALLSLWLAGTITRPIERLALAASRLASGERGVRVGSQGSDEIAVLGQRFNAMADELENRSEKMEAQAKTYETMLRSIFPDMIADRLGAGDRIIAETYPDVSVIVVLIHGIEALMTDRTADETLKLLNDLVGSFDAAGERYGIDKVKTLGEIYIGVCSLSGRRADHVRRALNAARAYAGIVERFCLQHGFDLSIRIGIDSGEIDGGIVGTQRLVYDVWGLPVAAARRAAELAAPGTIGISGRSMKQIEALLGRPATRLADISFSPLLPPEDTAWQISMDAISEEPAGRSRKAEEVSP